MNELLKDVKIENMICEIGEKKVILDSDLAYLYHVETRLLNQKLKRNKKDFQKYLYFN